MCPKLRFENSSNKNTLNQAWRFLLLYYLFVTQGGLNLLTKLRFENSPNKKTLNQAWRFLLLYYLFVTQGGFEPPTLRAEI